jgi:hypothetical protein
VSFSSADCRSVSASQIIAQYLPWFVVFWSTTSIQLTVDACFSCCLIFLVGVEGLTSVSIPRVGTIPLIRSIMESPDSDTSPDAESSSADSTSADSSPAQAQPSIGEIQVMPAMETTTVIHNDDSASDVSMSTDSEDDDDSGPNTTSISATPIIQHMTHTTTLATIKPEAEAFKKRKYSGLMDTPNGHMDNGILHEIRKRLKPDDIFQSHWTPEGHLRKDKSLLPPEIWHHIFTFCPPRVLGLLLQVNRTFNAYLDPSSPGRSREPLSRSVVQILTPDVIWRASRLLHLPGTPVPLARKSELDMWKLACGSLCQFCRKRRQPNSTVPMDQWHPGPGENGVIPIWAFGIRTCGSCVQSRSTKVGDLVSIFSAPATSNFSIGNRLTPVFYSFPSDGSSTLYLSHQ